MVGELGAAAGRTEIHDMITADGTVLDDDVPRPEGNGAPLLDILAGDMVAVELEGGTHLLHFEAWLTVSGSAFPFAGGGGIFHVDVSHG